MNNGKRILPVVRAMDQSNENGWGNHRGVSSRCLSLCPGATASCRGTTNPDIAMLRLLLAVLHSVFERYDLEGEGPLLNRLMH